MCTIELINSYSPFLSFLVTAILVAITGYYAYITKQMLTATKELSKLALDPVIGFEIKEIGIGSVFGPNRRNLSIDLQITNVGNAPAIEVLIDAEIELRYSEINGNKIIPARFEPFMIPFIKSDVSIENSSLNFGNSFIIHFFDDARESSRLNQLRIETEPHKEAYKTSQLRIFVYYKNSLGQYFKSMYQVEIGMSTYREAGKPPPELPGDDETATVQMSYIPRPKYESQPITKIKMENEIVNRNEKRDLCGW